MKAIKISILSLLILISSFLLISCTKEIKIENFNFEKQQVETYVGCSIYLDFKKFPENANYYKIEFTSSDKEVATINSNCKVTAKGYGTAVITGRDTISGATASCTVTVTDGKVFKIEVNSDYVKTQYYQGQTFKSDGLQVQAYYQSGRVKTLEEDEYSITCPDVLNENTSVTVNYQTFSKSFDVTVVPDYATEIEITEKPTKTTYYIGETFDPSGIKVSLVYASGRKEEIDDFLFDRTQLEYNTTSIKVTYGEFETSFDVKVDAKVKINDFSKLQAAIDNAEDGDSIMILDGSYNTGVSITIPSSKNIIIIGQTQNTTINGYGVPIFTITDDGAAGNISIIRLTLTLASGENIDLISNENDVPINLIDVII